MPKIRVPFEEFFNRIAKGLQFKLSTVILPWPHGNNEFGRQDLYDGETRVGERNFLEVNGERDGLTVEISSSAWDKVLPEVKRVAAEYEKESGLDVIIKKG